MKRLIALSMCTLVAFAFVVSDAGARRAEPRPAPVLHNPTVTNVGLDVRNDQMPLRSAAGPDTTILGFWDFDDMGACSADGWTVRDVTAQIGTFFHVDDFAGLGGGNEGRYYPLEGTKSLWCGARPSTTHYELCGYAALPGYGNSWDQSFTTKACLNVAGDVSVTYALNWSSEPGYDRTRPEHDACDDNWNAIISGSTGGYYPQNTVIEWDGWGERTETIVVPDSLHNGQLRFRMHFTSDGAWSDEDGLWDTDGAIIFDSLSVSDATGLVLAVEDFEDDPLGATSVQDWEATTAPAYGDFSGLFPATSLVQEDPCRSNVTCVWGFFNGSPADYGCGGFPGQKAMPFQNALGQALANDIESPLVPWAGSGTTAELEFEVYRDLPLVNLQFFIWSVRSFDGSCPGGWTDRNFVYYGDQKDWFRMLQPIGDLILPTAVSIQIRLGAIDMCPVWCGVYGTGACHSHAPLFDNVELRRIASEGPVWNFRDLDLFQDNFAEDGTLTGTVRADQANNTNNWNVSHRIIPGDSAVIGVDDPDVGLAGDPFTGIGPAVYAWVAVWPQGQAGKSGQNLAGDPTNYPLVDSTSHAGATWYQFRCDSVGNSPNYYQLTNAFAIDLNDSLYTPGDTVCFFFGAQSAAPSNVWSYFSRGSGTTYDWATAADNPMEFTCLPAGGYNRGGEILYVDGMDGRGAQPHFDTAFEQLGILDLVDRYDIRAPSSLVGNRPGARVVNVFQQIIAPYSVIIWNTGDLARSTIGDGGDNPDYSDDAALLFTFLDQKTTPGGVYFSGDNIADELYNRSNPTGSLINLRNYITGSVAAGAGDHTSMGLGVAPLGVGQAGSCFDHILGPDSLVAYGGCPIVNDFDVITPSGTAITEMSYHGAGNTASAIISQTTNNAAGQDVGVILSGFSFHEIREDIPRGVPARTHHMHDVLAWLGTLTSVPSKGHSPVGSTQLAQNYPNPFNPTTTIAFTLRKRGHVTLRVYNVAGQLVQTLVNEVRAGDVAHTVEWDGRNARGSHVASGVYFYRLVTTDATMTRKMVLLK